MTMKTRIIVSALAVVLCAPAAFAQDARGVIEAASKAMGVAGMHAIMITGAAAQGNFGQSRRISFGLASTSLNNYTRTFDFARGVGRTTADTVPPQIPGGPAPRPGKIDQAIAPDAPWTQQLEIWLTPWGFLRGAATHAATLRNQKIEGSSFRVVTWSPEQKAPSGLSYKVSGYLTADNLVDHVETWVEHPIVGDMHVEEYYRNYRAVNGVMMPARVEEKRVGMQTLVARYDSVVANPANLSDLLAKVPEHVPVPPPLPPAASEKLADGVYRITGGYVAMAVELKDGIVVLEGPQSEARGLAIIAETKRLFPGRKIKYVVNTHPHFDHASGLGPFMADGITVITDDNNKAFIEQAFSEPRTLAGDTLARSKKKPKVEGVIDDMVLGDPSGRTIELHQIKQLQHSDGMLVAYLPKERILFSADFNIPAAGQPPAPQLATLVENLDRLHIDFDRYVTVHAPNPDRPLTKADLLAVTGK